MYLRGKFSIFRPTVRRLREAADDGHRRRSKLRSCFFGNTKHSLFILCSTFLSKSEMTLLLLKLRNCCCWEVLRLLWPVFLLRHLCVNWGQQRRGFYEVNYEIKTCLTSFLFLLFLLLLFTWYYFVLKFSCS